MVGTIDESSSMSSKVILKPQASAIAIKWIVRFVEPPLAINPTIPFTQLFEVSISPVFIPSFFRSSTAFTVLSIINCLSVDSGETNEELGNCKPITSMIS